MKIIVLNYAIGAVDIITDAPDYSEDFGDNYSNSIEEWLATEKGYNLDEISYMCGDDFAYYLNDQPIILPI